MDGIGMGAVQECASIGSHRSLSIYHPNDEPHSRYDDTRSLCGTEEAWCIIRARTSDTITSMVQDTVQTLGDIHEQDQRYTDQLFHYIVPSPCDFNTTAGFLCVAVFNLQGFDRVLFLDGDVVLVRDLDSFFDFPAAVQFAAVVDQWDGCKRREVLNGGVWSFVPRYTYNHKHSRCLPNTSI